MKTNLIWRQTIVTEDVLIEAVSRLLKAIGEDANKEQPMGFTPTVQITPLRNSPRYHVLVTAQYNTQVAMPVYGGK